MTGRSRSACALVLLVAACGSPGTATSSPAAGTPTEPAATIAGSETPAPRPAPTYPAGVLDRPDFSPLESATYFIEPEEIPVRVLFTVAADGWVSWIGTFKPEQSEETGYRFVGISIVNVTDIVVDACTDHRPSTPTLGPTVDDLASALATLPPFLVSKQPRKVEAFGYRGKHLELTVPDLALNAAGRESSFPDCTDGDLKSWIGPPLSYAFYGYSEPGQREEFWILDVDGDRLVIEATWSPDSPPSDIDEMRAVLESIEIEPT